VIVNAFDHEFVIIDKVDKRTTKRRSCQSPKSKRL